MKQFDRARQRIGRALGRRDQTPDDQQLLAREVERHGAELLRVNDPGLPAALVLAVFRRDQYRCTLCLSQNHPLTVHHVRHQHREGAANERTKDTADLNTVCSKCHDAVHELQRDRQADEGTDGGAEDEDEDEDEDE